MAACLIKHGADVNAVDMVRATESILDSVHSSYHAQDSKTPLHWAANSYHDNSAEFARFLILEGASVNCKDRVITDADTTPCKHGLVLTLLLVCLTTEWRYSATFD
jgi:ankyrin repeat protein